MDNVINGLMNFLLVSVPEETIWCLTTLILLRRFDLLDKYRWKENIKLLAIPILFSSILINLLRYFNTPRPFISLTAILTIYIGIVFVLKLVNILNEKIPYIKTFMFVILVAISIILIESLYGSFFVLVVKKSIVEINDVWLINFIFSIPIRVIQFLLILLILTLQNRKTYLHLLQSIFIDKKITLTIVSFISIMLIFWIILIDVFGNYNIISQLSLIYQILLNLLVFIVPSILLVLMIYIIILFIEKINQIQKSHQNMFNILDDDIK